MFHFFRNRELSEAMRNTASFLGQSIISGYFFYPVQNNKYPKKLIPDFQNRVKKDSSFTNYHPH